MALAPLAPASPPPRPAVAGSARRLKLELAVMQSFRVGVALLGQRAQRPDVDGQGAVVVLHELGKVQQHLQDFGWDRVGAECRLQGVHETILVLRSELRPARHKRRVEQLPSQRVEDLCKRRARAQSRVGRLPQQLHRKPAHPLHPVLARRPLARPPRVPQILLVCVQLFGRAELLDGVLPGRGTPSPNAHHAAEPEPRLVVSPHVS